MGDLPGLVSRRFACHPLRVDACQAQAPAARTAGSGRGPRPAEGGEPGGAGVGRRHCPDTGRRAAVGGGGGVARDDPGGAPGRGRGGGTLAVRVAARARCLYPPHRLPPAGPPRPGPCRRPRVGGGSHRAPRHAAQKTGACRLRGSAPRVSHDHRPVRETAPVARAPARTDGDGRSARQVRRARAAATLARHLPAAHDPRRRVRRPAGAAREVAGSDALPGRSARRLP